MQLPKKQKKGRMNKKTKENKKEEKNNYKVICKFGKNGPSFQKVMEEMLINKLNNMNN